jgi:hypothetical protein
MSEQRKLLVWPWLAALVIGLPVLYFVSFGPTCWVTSYVQEGRFRSFAEEGLPVDVIYQPILSVWWGGDWPKRGDFIDRYSRLAAKRGWRFGRRDGGVGPYYRWTESLLLELP